MTRRSRAHSGAFVLGLALGALVLLASGIVEHREQIVATNDFSLIWAGAYATAHGLDVYDIETYRRVNAELGTQAPLTSVYTYPPWVAIALAPLGLLPLSIASNIWLGFGLVVAALALHAVLRSFVPDLPLVHFVAGLLLLASFPGLATYFTGQWSYLLLAATSGTMLALRDGQPRLAGGLAIATLAKPQLFTFWLWSWVCAADAAGRLGPFASRALTGMTAVVVTISFLYPSRVLSWISNVLLGARASDPSATTLVASLTDLFGASGSVLAAVVLFGTLWLALRERPGTNAWWSIWPVVSVLGATYSRSYDQLLLLPSLIVSTGSLAQASRSAATRYTIVWAALLLPASLLLQGLAAVRGREDLSIAITIGVFLLVLTAERSAGHLYAERGS